MSAATAGAAVRRLAARFAAAGIPSARLDAELLVAHALGVDRTRLFLSPERPLDAETAARVADLERRRAEERESVAHLTGVRGFRHLDLTVDSRVLIPRPETELLVELGLELPTGTTVVDVGTGSGAIALALADERPDLDVHATDVSAAALAVARANAARLGARVAFHEGDLLAGVPPLGAGVAVLSNPPYVPERDRETLPPEVLRHDPHLALFGGPDGLDVIRRLLPAARAFGATLVGLEVGEGQAPAVADLAVAAGFTTTEIRDDLAGIGRVVVARAAAPAEASAVLPLDPEAIGELTRATARGGIALFPAEGVYGLAADPGHPDAVRRIARLKGRDPGKPSSVLFWALDDALAAVDGVGERALEALARLLPGPVGVVVANPARRFPAAAGDRPETLGLRVPALAAPVTAPPVVQTSANRAGEPDPSTVDAVPRPIRRACDVVLDRGPRPGVPSTVVDLCGLSTPGGGWRVLREGAVPAARIAAALDDLGPRVG